MQNLNSITKENSYLYNAFNLMLYDENDDFDSMAAGYFASIIALEIAEANVKQSSALTIGTISFVYNTLFPGQISLTKPFFSVFNAIAAMPIAVAKDYCYTMLQTQHLTPNAYNRIVNEFAKIYSHDMDNEAKTEFKIAINLAEYLALQTNSVLKGILGGVVKALTSSCGGDLYSLAYIGASSAPIIALSYNMKPIYSDVKNVFSKMKTFYFNDNMSFANISNASQHYLTSLKVEEDNLNNAKTMINIFNYIHEIYVDKGGWVDLANYLKFSDISDPQLRRLTENKIKDSTFFIGWLSLNSQRIIDFYNLAEKTSEAFRKIQDSVTNKNLNNDLITKGHIKSNFSEVDKSFSNLNVQPSEYVKNSFTFNLFKLVMTNQEKLDNSALGKLAGLLFIETIRSAITTKTLYFFDGVANIGNAMSLGLAIGADYLYSSLTSQNFAYNAFSNIFSFYNISHSIHGPEKSKLLVFEAIIQSDGGTYQIGSIMRTTSSLIMNSFQSAGKATDLLQQSVSYLGLNGAILMCVYNLMERDYNKTKALAIELATITNQKFNSGEDFKKSAMKNIDEQKEVEKSLAFGKGISILMSSFHENIVKNKAWISMKMLWGNSQISQNDQTLLEEKAKLFADATSLNKFCWDAYIKVLDFIYRTGKMSELAVKLTSYDDTTITDEKLSQVDTEVIAKLMGQLIHQTVISENDMGL